MKKCLVVLMAVAALMLFAPMASASYIFCQGAGTGGNGVVALTGQPVTLTCPAIVVPLGVTLFQVDLELVDDAQGPAGIGSTVHWDWNGFIGVPEAGTQTNTEVSTNGFTFNPCTGAGINGTCAPTMLSYAENVVGAAGFGPVSVVVNAYFEGNLNAHGGDSAELYIQYDESPEPATFGLIGGALLGLGIFGSKRFARR